MKTRRTRALTGASLAALLVGFIVSVASPAHADAITPVAKPATVTFTTCGQTGRFGPSADQCATAYAGQPQMADGSGFRVDNGYQYWTVPATGLYEVQIAGAGHYGDWRGGKGARFTTTVRMLKGQVLKILVGQGARCSDNDWTGCGGSGGTFVSTQDNQPIAVAGGGGGRGRVGLGYGNSNAVLTREPGCPMNPGGNCDGSSGHGTGLGGYAWWCGTGGGGFAGDGDTSCWDPFRGGQAFVNGGVGGWSQCGVADGGFGGGGAGYGCWQGSGGGGGGYSGGSGVDNYYWCWVWCYTGRSAGGGGSFSAAEMRELGLNDGDGFVIVAAGRSSAPLIPSLSGVASGLTSVDLLWKVNLASDWDSVATHQVQVSTDTATWVDVAAVDGAQHVLSVPNLPCGTHQFFRLRSINATGPSVWSTPTDVLLTASTPTVCPSRPLVTVPGKSVTVSLVGLLAKETDTATGYVIVSVNGASVQVPVNSEGVASFNYTPTAAGKGVIKAQFTTVNKKTYRVTNYRFQGSVWTANVRLPRSATVGRSVSVNVGNVAAGEVLTITTAAGSVDAAATSAGNVSVPVTFSAPGLADISISYRGTVLASGTVTVVNKK